jgi:isopentenyl-diphosphate delta-isomerase
MDTEKIVFVNEDGTPTGEIGPKLASHTARTKLHLAFSCYIFRRADNKFLLTQRALAKKVWPGVWTNSVCGHPLAGEAIENAIRRRTTYELGIEELEGIDCILPSYRYTTPPYNGIIENEFCPVYIAYALDKVNKNPTEVETYKWVEWFEYITLLDENPDKVSYWAKDQYLQLKGLAPFTSLATTN